MNVMGYTKTGEIRVVFEGDDHESFVSDDMGNRHRQKIAEWEAEGNVIPRFTQIQSGFKPIPKYDFWLAVDSNLNIKKDTVLDAIDASELDADAKYLARLGITDAQTYLRDDPNVIALLSLMGFKPDEADAFWLWAQPA